MLTKTEMLAVMRRHNFYAKKRFAQNFLIDKNLAQKILASVNIGQKDVVLEIGPGFGILTEGLANSSKEVIAVEIDKVLCDILSESLTRYSNLKIINKDILQFDIPDLPSGAALKIVGNLPYYITTPILTWMFKYRGLIRGAFITIQKEMARRLVAAPGRREYGPLSCYVQFYTLPRLIMNINRNAFFPVPEVDSSMVALEFLKKPAVDVKDESLFFKVVHAGFQQRRKTLFNALANSAEMSLSKDEVSAILKKCGIDPKRRAETLSLDEFAKIANGMPN